jgi:hypothetical protein
VTQNETLYNASEQRTGLLLYSMAQESRRSFLCGGTRIDLGLLCSIRVIRKSCE